MARFVALTARLKTKPTMESLALLVKTYLEVSDDSYLTIQEQKTVQTCPVSIFKL